MFVFWYISKYYFFPYQLYDLMSSTEMKKKKQILCEILNRYGERTRMSKRQRQTESYNKNVHIFCVSIIL